MDKSNKKYSRLPGKKRKFLGKDTLWTESDHILMVESSGMSEDYKRFYFKDIQSISITKTLSATITNSILAVVIILFSIWAAYLWKSLNAASAFPLIVACVCLFYLVINLFKGASCNCWLTTAVQRVKLTPVNRCRAAIKMMEILGPKIEQQQGIATSNVLDEIIKKAESNPVVKDKAAVSEQDKKITAGEVLSTAFDKDD